MSRPGRLRGEAGVTRVELLVTMAVMAVLMGIVGPMLISAMTATNRLERTGSAVDDARLVVAQLDRELRSAQCISAPGENQAGNELTFRMLTEVGQSTLTYQVSGATLSRQADGGAKRELISSVGATGTAFRQVVTPLRTVQVNIPIRSGNGAEFLLQTTIAGRNAWRSC